MQDQYNRNNLGGSSSPYLRQHSGNPIWWQEWNSETLAYAAAENKPLFVSVGYATCHWCHTVMSFTPPEQEAPAADAERLIESLGEYFDHEQGGFGADHTSLIFTTSTCCSQRISSISIQPGNRFRGVKSRSTRCRSAASRRQYAITGPAGLSGRSPKLAIGCNSS